MSYINSDMFVILTRVPNLPKEEENAIPLLSHHFYPLTLTFLFLWFSIVFKFYC